MRPAFIVFLLALCPASTIAESPVAPPPFRTTGAFFALSVPDLEASRDWYMEKLGLAVVLEPPPYQDIRTLVLEGGGLTVELIHSRSAQPTPGGGDPTQRHGFFKAGVFVGDLDHTLARLRERGVSVAFGPFPSKDGQPANVAIRDNAGNLIQFFGR
jgi:catechol 2,3-dioxygenase-like lactoylglutathione lyase family enzyme